MATGMNFNVMGPLRIDFGYAHTSNEGPPTVTKNLGYTDNDDLPEFVLNHMYHEEFSTCGGRVPGALINEGAMGTLTFTLVQWDESEVHEFTRLPGTTPAAAAQPAGLYVGTVGTDLVSGVTPAADTEGFIWLRLTRRLTGATGEVESITFPRCHIPDGDSLRFFGHGNVARRLGVRLTVRPYEVGSPSDEDLTTGNHVLYTIEYVSA